MLGFHWSFIALLGFQTVPACSREVKLLPYLLGTAPRPAKWLALKNSNERKKFRQATCSFASIGFMSNLARLTFMMRNIVNSCPQSAIDTASYQPGEEATLPVKVCLLSTTALFAALAQLARSLTVLISTCERTATVDEGCAASIETLMVPAVLFINGGIAISAACDKGAIDLPKEIEPGRRLMNPLDLPVKRQWDIAQCTVDAIDATRSVAAIGLSMDAVARNCPVNYATPFTEELSRTACTVDVSVLLTSFTRLVFYLALAVNHCSPEPERDAICLVGVAAIAAGGTTTSAGAAGTHATCNLGRKRQFIQRLEEMQANETLPEEDAAAAAAADAAVNNAPFNIIRRLVKRRRLRSLNRSREMERIDEIWLKLGYNLSDANASWLKEDSNPEILEIQAEAEDFRRNVASSLTASQPEWAPGMPLKVAQRGFGGAYDAGRRCLGMPSEMFRDSKLRVFLLLDAWRSLPHPGAPTDAQGCAPNNAWMGFWASSVPPAAVAARRAQVGRATSRMLSFPCTVPTAPLRCGTSSPSGCPGLPELVRAGTALRLFFLLRPFRALPFGASQCDKAPASAEFCGRAQGVRI
ncbi:unnamed protein product [Durusdinium trenchii]|uniref:Uncharacterized protein n=1 Tax=Durusdinium trenchii TaxID=1381693 RepID=A0ABP0QAP8_9DINO